MMQKLRIVAGSVAGTQLSSSPTGSVGSWCHATAPPPARRSPRPARANLELRGSVCVAVPAVRGPDAVDPPRPRSPYDRSSARVANIKSQIKRIQTNEKRRLRNKSVKSSLKTAIRSTREAVDAGDRDNAVARLQAATRQLDKAASKGVIHPNQAANKKSSLARRVAAL